VRTVTVIIPTNRINPWLDEAVNSVLASTDVEVDLIVVFDGVENTTLPNWITDPRVRIIRHATSLGPSAGMTSALAIAQSDLVARLDSDDVASPERLALQSAYLDAHSEAVAVSSKTLRIDENGTPTGLVRLPFGDDVRINLLLSNVVPHSTLMFRREVGERVGGYDDKLRQMEDYDFILRLATQGPIAQFAEPLVKYRVHSTQTSRGAQPSGPHITKIIGTRRQLARILGKSKVTSELRNAVWILAQHLRHSGVIRPHHEH
jgi:glycosyltransferase involved in cell wall biosynthesis